MTATKIVHVPYKSATMALTGALSGEVDIVIVAASSVVNLVKDGRIRALAVLDVKRIASMPDIPTAAEAGVPQVVIVNWYMLLAPAGTPRAIVDRLNAETVKAMSAADVRERLDALGGGGSVSTPEQAGELLRREHEQWGRVIREAGIKSD